jgi:hypothetical protein
MPIKGTAAPGPQSAAAGRASSCATWQVTLGVARWLPKPDRLFARHPGTAGLAARSLRLAR